MPTKAGITFSWRIRPVRTALIALQKSRRNAELVVVPWGCR